ncbi:MAG TPA: glycosyltransferase [Actinomycetota bacterium]|nr:glycosyltransferase [Actinomycetota bacterium]
MTDVPPQVHELVKQRARARADRDFARADALRDRIGELGYRVVDGPEGSSLEPVAAERSPRRRAGDVPSVLGEPATADVSLHWVVEGWPDDVARAVASFRRFAGHREVHYVVADLTETDPATYGDDVEVVSLEAGTGWAAARNAGLRRSRGRVVVALDGSVEAIGDAFGPLEAALADPSVGVCGPFGISTEDLREFHESTGPEVDAVEGYLMAFRRDLLGEIARFDERFRWYRTADIELCFRLKDAGFRALVVHVPVARHEHRMWTATSPEERDRLSRRNYNRFLERFRGRFDLLVSRQRD